MHQPHHSVSSHNQFRHAIVASCDFDSNSVTEVLQVMLLNNIKIKHQASQIVAMDWAKGVAVLARRRASVSTKAAM